MNGAPDRLPQGGATKVGESMSTPKWRQQHSTVHDVTTATGRHLKRERERARHVFDPIADGRVLVGPDGSAALERVSERIEGELAAQLAGQRGLRVLAGLRQLSPRLWTLNAGNSQEMQQAALNIAELAVHCYADWDCPIATGEMSPPRWTDTQARLLARVLVLAEYYGNTLASRRRTGKGQALRFEPDDILYPYAPESTTSHIGELIKIRDERGRRDDNLMAAYGGYLDPEDDGAPTGRIIAAERQHPDQFGPINDLINSLVARTTDGRPHRRLLDKERDEAWRAMDHSARWDFLPDLGPRLVAVNEYDEALKAQLGFGFADIELVLDVCTSKVLEQSNSLVFLNDYGFELAAAPTADDFADRLTSSRADGSDAWPGVTVSSAFAALTFLDAGAHPGDLANPLACRPLRLLGNVMLYDAIHVRFPSPLVWEVDFDEPVRDRLARRFESDVHAAIAEFGKQPWSSGRKLRIAGRVFTDVDASVVVADLLVVVDCYSSRWTPQLDIGSYRPTRNRAQDLIGKLEKWDGQWAEAATDHPDVFPAGVRRVLPVVATIGAEWILSTDERLWFNETRPRICTLAELVDELRSPSAGQARSIIDVCGR